ncbi:MAG: GGDEF and EAL domain-containing protein [Bacillota bacterium]
MKEIKFRKISIVVYVIVLLMLVITLQSAFSLSTIVMTNITTRIESFSYSSFTKTIQNRKTNIEGFMTSSWSNISDISVTVSENYIEMIGNQKELDENEKVEFLSDSVELVMEMISRTGTTGGFIILDDGENMKYNYSTLYLKSDNYLTQTVSYDKLMLAKGPMEISKEYGFSLLSTWGYALELTEDCYDIMSEPMRASEITKNQMYLGYWSVMQDVTNENLQVLTYTVPILDKDGEPVGVIGVELSQEYLYKFLPNDEFADEGSFGYVLATFDQETDSFTPIISRGAAQSELIVLDTPMTLSDLNLQRHNLEVDPKVFSVGENDVCTYYELLDVYANNTPFADSELWLVGMVNLENMTSFTSEFWKSMMAMLAISLLGGVLISYFVGKYFASPIIKLSKAVSANDVRREIDFQETRIKELDELANVIKQLQQENIIRTTTKTDKILELLNIGVGSFEYIKGASSVTISQAVYKMLEIEEESFGSKIPKEIFFDKLEFLKQSPISELQHTYATGEAKIKYYTVQEFEQEDAILGVIEDSTKEVEDLIVLNFERNYDVLTGIMNRRAFYQTVEEIFRTADMKVAGFIMFDLDNLKYVNDTFGHDFGDLYIKTAANLISNVLTKNGVVGRMSGDEFYAYLYGLNSKEELLACLDELYASFEVELIEMPNTKQFQIRMSGGIAWYNDDSTNLDELMKFADFAMYKGKQSLKGELREFDKAMYLKESFMLSGKEELNRILDEELIKYFFQPIIDVKTGKIHAYEALMRPISETLGTPDKFLQIATQEGKLWKVEKITFYKTLFFYRKYKDLFAGAKIFINSIPSENLTEANYKELEDLYKDCFPYLVVEITEQEQQSEDAITKKLKDLRSLGLQVALDDYGSGYANDVNLLKIRPNIVKIDRTLISNVHVDPSRQTIVNKIITFCKENDICVLGEGVETAQELEYLMNAGIELAQGYYISRPLERPNFDTTIIEEKIHEIHSANKK